MYCVIYTLATVIRRAFSEANMHMVEGSGYNRCIRCYRCSGGIFLYLRQGKWEEELWQWFHSLHSQVGRSEWKILIWMDAGFEARLIFSRFLNETLAHAGCNPVGCTNCSQAGMLGRNSTCCQYIEETEMKIPRDLQADNSACRSYYGKEG